MKKKIIILCIAVILITPVYAQTKKKAATNYVPQTSITQKKPDVRESLPKVYDEKRESREVYHEGLEEARASGRLLMCQVGGNWCPWCLRLANLVNTNEAIAKIIKENFVYVHINVPSNKEDRDYELMRQLGNPGRFGYPALVIVDQDEHVLHIQNSTYLEQGEDYDTKKVMEFFQQWTYEAINNVE